MNQKQLEAIQRKLHAIPKDKILKTGHGTGTQDTSLYLDHIEAEFSGKGKLETYTLYPGIEITFMDFLTDQITFSHEANDSIIEINHCRCGRSGWNVASGNTIYLGSEDYAIHTMEICARSSMNFPCGYYEGITICIDIKQLTENPPELIKNTGITGDFLYGKFCPNGKFTAFPGSDRTVPIFSAFYDQPEKLRLPYFRLKIQELLLYLGSIQDSPGRELTQYQADQIESIKEIHEHLIQNLSQRLTIEDLSKQYLMNTTTLKSVFKAVYGTSLAAHIKEHRMEKAASLLLETNDRIAQIAKDVGYDNQSKFTAAFKEVYQVLPTEYRKQHSANKDIVRE